VSNIKYDVKATSNGLIKFLEKQAADSKDKKIYVGIQKKNKRDPKVTSAVGPIKPKQRLTNAQIGLWQEFGTQDATGKKRIPPRSFIRSTLYEQRKEYARIRDKIARAILDKKETAINGMKKLGLRASGDIKNKITSLKEPPNAKSTIRKKKSDNPLIDTTQMRNSVGSIIATEKEIA
jgi:hypothetical protein